MSLTLNRRDLLKSLSTLSVAGSTAGMFVPLAQAAETDKAWTGFAICDHCNHVPMCGIQFHARGNVIESIENWKENPRHILCSKGLATLQRLYNPNRLLYPMKRTNPKGSADPGFVRCSWQEAYKMIADNLLRIRKQHGADSVMFYAGDPKEPRPPIMRLARKFGSVMWASESSAACRAACMQAEILTWGCPSTGSMPTKDTRSFLILATNAWAQPLGWWESLVAAKARGCKIITIDTRRTKAAELADIHLAPKVGTDAALAMGIMNVLIRENLYDREFVQKWCHGFEELKAYAAEFTPEKTEAITGVPAKDVVAAARMYAEGPGSFSLTTQSLTHNLNGVNNARALLLIPCIMGYIDVPGGATFPSNPKGQQMAAFGLHPSMYDAPWWKAKEQKDRRLDKDFVPVWHHMMNEQSPNLLPEWVRDGRIRAFCGWGFNVLIWPQPQEYQAAIRQMEFAFATDYFYRKESHDDMDLLLPAAMNFERYAPFGMYGPKFAPRKPVKPLGEAREDWRIALEIGCLVGDPKDFFNGDPVAACDFVLHQWDADYMAAQAKLPAVSALKAEKNAPRKYELGRMRPDGKPGFNTPTGKIELFSTITSKFGFDGLPVYKPMMKPEGEFNLQLINGTRKPYITHSKTRSDAPYLLEIEPMSTIHMHPKDAQARGLKTGDLIEMRSAFGGPVKARLDVSIIVPEGTIDSQYGWRGDQNTQVLIPRQWDPISGYAPYFEVYVSVKKVEGGAA